MTEIVQQKDVINTMGYSLYSTICMIYGVLWQSNDFMCRSTVDRRSTQLLIG